MHRNEGKEPLPHPFKTPVLDIAHQININATGHTRYAQKASINISHFRLTKRQENTEDAGMIQKNEQEKKNRENWCKIVEGCKHDTQNMKERKGAENSEDIFKNKINKKQNTI